MAPYLLHDFIRRNIILNEIIIDGQQLSEAEKTTIHVAINNFIMDLKTNRLGEDLHGKTMTELYLTHCKNIQRKLIGGIDL